MFVDGEACVKKCEEGSEWFYKQWSEVGCFLSQWLFNLCLNEVMKQLKVRLAIESVRPLEDG